ncbi:hypothetical protein [Longitalea arenae]|uniref:hypothetical protein n=1 Tax=Longitalea arenae TaxID=2812558 RepID=UPI0019682C75|nr:hypothetical protein [Longitalea arenae]
MKKTVFSLVALTAVIVAGCSKDNDNGSPEKMIQGKWTPVSTTVKVTDIQNGGTTTSNKPVYQGDYLDFRSDGKLYRRTTDPSEGPGYDPHDTLTYQFSRTYLIIEDDSMLISKLTNDSLSFILQEQDANKLWETTYSLKK